MDIIYMYQTLNNSECYLSNYSQWLCFFYSDPEYSSKIFLDCCGLTRRVMRDLQKDFGFRIGPWNQAYQHDTLPIVIDKEEDMKPGDLVFISAIYHNLKSKHGLIESRGQWP